MITGERQAARIRALYLKAILRQDISFFDKETNSGEVVGRMSGDTVLIQEAMGEKVLMHQFIDIIMITKFECNNLLFLYLCDILSGRKIHTVCVIFFRRLSCGIHQGLASNACPSIFSSTSCPLWFHNELCFCKDGVPWTSSLFRSSNYCRSDSWVNSNGMHANLPP